MLIGITGFSILVEIILIWFVDQKLSFTVGLLLGTFMAMMAAIHMWWILDKAMDLGGGAQKLVLTHNIIRYGVILVAFFLICLSKVIDPLEAFIGIMGLKVGAYVQPFTHKWLCKKKKENRNKDS